MDLTYGINTKTCSRYTCDTFADTACFIQSNHDCVLLSPRRSTFNACSTQEIPKEAIQQLVGVHPRTPGSAAYSVARRVVRRSKA